MDAIARLNSSGVDETCTISHQDGALHGLSEQALPYVQLIHEGVDVVGGASRALHQLNAIGERIWTFLVVLT